MGVVLLWGASILLGVVLTLLVFHKLRTVACYNYHRRGIRAYRDDPEMLETITKGVKYHYREGNLNDEQFGSILAQLEETPCRRGY